MDLRADCGTVPAHTAVENSAMEEELSLSNARCQTQGGGTILLHLLQFKTLLLETFEELHIRRDAEARFEDQISKLVLEKQELEWETESLRHQIEMLSNQHSESLTSVKKQLQANITNIKEEKEKYQVSAELKDKEINNLKEELKSLQGQKLALHSRSKESHLNQLGEVEKRFSALSWQCAMLKQAHGKLEQNVEEALKMKKKLTALNEKQEATVASLKEKLEEVSHKLIKAKMTSVRRNEASGATGREQHCEQLHHQLNMETEMNKKLCEENEAVRAEKQEVISCLQHTQQLLLSQTQTVRRVEQQLHILTEERQALKREQRARRERSQAAEDEVAQLMESDGASKPSWDEKAVFLERIEGEQQQLRAVTKAHEELRREHSELSSRAKVHAHHVCESEMRGGVPTEGIRWKGTLNEPISGSEPLSFGSLQHLASAHTHSPDRLENTRVAAERDATGASGESTVLSYGLTSVDGSVGWISLGQSDERSGGTKEREKSWKYDAAQVENDRDEGKGHQELQWKEERHDVKEGGSLRAQTADGGEGILGSAQDPKRPKTGTTQVSGALDAATTRQQAGEAPIADQTPAGRTTGQSRPRPVDDFKADSGAESDSSCPGKRYKTPLAECCSNHGPNRVVQEGQSLQRNEISTVAESVTPCPIHLVIKKTEADMPTNRVPKSQTTQPQPGDPSDIRKTSAEPYKLSGQLMSPRVNDDGGSAALKDGECQSSVDARENENSNVCADIAMDTADLETGSSPELMATVKMDGVEDAITSKASTQPSVHPGEQSEALPEAACAENSERSPGKEMLHGGTDQSPVLGNKMHGPSSGRAAAQRRTEHSTHEAHAAFLHPLVQDAGFMVGRRGWRSNEMSEVGWLCSSVSFVHRRAEFLRLFRSAGCHGKAHRGVAELRPQLKVPSLSLTGSLPAPRRERTNSHCSETKSPKSSSSSTRRGCACQKERELTSKGLALITLFLLRLVAFTSCSTFLLMR
ncbi:coiled-coil domain-containing protein 73 isoform 3-T4 [Spinachia spinachia]